MLPFLIRVVLLTLVWAALQGSFSVSNLLMGAILGAFVVWALSPLYDPNDPDERTRLTWRVRPVRRMWRIFVLIVVFLRELFISGFRVARYTIAPSLDIRPGIVAYPLDVTTDREITALANLISLTPGTLSLDVSKDRKTLYIHAISIYDDDGAEVIQDIKSSLERHVSRAIGPRNTALSTNEQSA